MNCFLFTDKLHLFFLSRIHSYEHSVQSLHGDQDFLESFLSLLIEKKWFFRQHSKCLIAIKLNIWFSCVHHCAISQYRKKVFLIVTISSKQYFIMKLLRHLFRFYFVQPSNVLSAESYQLP